MQAILFILCAVNIKPVKKKNNYRRHNDIFGSSIYFPSANGTMKTARLANTK